MSKFLPMKRISARAPWLLGAAVLLGGCAQVLGLGDFADQPALSDGSGGVAGADAGGASSGGTSSGGGDALGGMGGMPAYQPFVMLNTNAAGDGAVFESADADLLGFAWKFVDASPGQGVTSSVASSSFCVLNSEQLLGAPVATYGLSLDFCTSAAACGSANGVTFWQWDASKIDGLYFSIAPNKTVTNFMPPELRVWVNTTSGDSYCAPIQAPFDGVLALADFKTHCDVGEAMPSTERIASIQWSTRAETAQPGGFCVDSLAIVPKGGTKPEDVQAAHTIDGGCAKTCRSWSSYSAASPAPEGACIWGALAGVPQGYTFSGMYDGSCGPPGERDDTLCADVNTFTACSL